VLLLIQGTLKNEEDMRDSDKMKMIAFNINFVDGERKSVLRSPCSYN
jgi:hypothetical protein